MITSVYFSVVPSVCMCILALQSPPPGPDLPREGAREVVRPGRRAARGGRRWGRKGAGKRGPCAPEKVRKRTVSVPEAVRYHCASRPRKLARKFPNSRRNGVDSCQKGELASLLYPEIPGEIPRQLQSRVMAKSVR